FSPIIGKGEADVIVAFEKMEALRWLEYLKPGGRMVINDFEIPSVPILMGAATYPKDVLSELSSKAAVSVCKAAEIAAELGGAKVMNVVLLGALVKALDMDDIDWKAMIAKNVKKDFAALNERAFEEGMHRI
ncbi:MAG: 2-oxoacid:acceptor oxidoreductase family protein, partial [Clostridiales Family XIII bacterium]|nr:2-oxoacid:acceptor oxidoreductase family protein [Clostridiales Family XIII bacterium]